MDTSGNFFKNMIIETDNGYLPRRSEYNTSESTFPDYAEKKKKNKKKKKLQRELLMMEMQSYFNPRKKKKKDLKKLKNKLRDLEMLDYGYDEYYPKPKKKHKKNQDLKEKLIDFGVKFLFKVVDRVANKVLDLLFNPRSTRC